MTILLLILACFLASLFMTYAGTAVATGKKDPYDWNENSAVMFVFFLVLTSFFTTYVVLSDRINQLML